MIQNLPPRLFFVVMGIAVIGWLALVFFPRRTWANFWFSGLFIPLLLSLSYIYVLLTYWLQPPVGQLTMFLSLGGVASMFTNHGLLLDAWIDILAMDLIVGAWMARRATQIRMPYIYLLPCFILTFAFAGLGFTIYTIIVATGSGWNELAKFEGQPPINASPAFAQPIHDSGD